MVQCHVIAICNCIAFDFMHGGGLRWFLTKRLHAVLVVPGGIGVSFDVLATNYALLKEHGVSLKGVILNKVDPSKIEQNKIYYQKALRRWGVPLMGVIPSDVQLPLLSMKSFAQLLQAEFLCGHDQKLR